MVVYPYAKINLGLHILRRRADGYHEIDTLMLPVDWTDVLEVERSDYNSDSLEATGWPIDCPPEKNLVLRAVARLREVVDFPPVAIRLRKVIPDGAGLGGGSSDAAFALKAVNQLFSLNISAEVLASVASKIGADCPFFLHDTPAICTGIGTELEIVDSPLPRNTWIVISKPDAFVSTKEAYSGVTPKERPTSLKTLIEATTPNEWTGTVVNDFEESVLRNHDAIAVEKELMTSAGAWYASMSGSGAAVYGFFNERPAMEETPTRRVCQLRFD